MATHKCVYRTKYGYGEHTFKSNAHTSTGLIRQAARTISQDSFFTDHFVTPDKVEIASIDDVPVFMLDFTTNICW